jgi:hypothetical protein|tara:strand:+ start:4740 stop:5306 length:567 start_codon:yes stop_codon:yes gene_type:complete
MEHFVRVTMEKTDDVKGLDESVFPTYDVFESEYDTTIYHIPLARNLSEAEADEYANRLSNYLFSEGFEDFDIDISSDDLEEVSEITYDDIDDFETDYGTLWFNEDDDLDEAEYQGRKVKLGKPMQGDVKKFKVYVKNPKGNVVKVNFGDPNMRIKKSNPDRRRSFRARHNCDNPGPRHKARYWSCRKW